MRLDQRLRVAPHPGRLSRYQRQPCANSRPKHRSIISQEDMPVYEYTTELPDVFMVETDDLQYSLGSFSENEGTPGPQMASPGSVMTNLTSSFVIIAQGDLMSRSNSNNSGGTPEEGSEVHNYSTPSQDSEGWVAGPEYIIDTQAITGNICPAAPVSQEEVLYPLSTRSKFETLVSSL